MSDSGGCLLTGVPSTVTYRGPLCVPVFVHRDVNIFAGGCTVRGCLCSTYAVITEVLSVRACARACVHACVEIPVGAGRKHPITNKQSLARCLFGEEVLR